MSDPDAAIEATIIEDGRLWRVALRWVSLSLSSGAHARDPLALPTLYPCYAANPGSPASE
ncbi:hypothetical protein SAMN05443247_01564 [Bradyrhizobium erythrophlei]|nr:hypothetical protein SAMN05443247_01564 [Bradyrhizobium erythrophlei]